MTVKTISKADYYKVVGLLSVGQEHIKRAEEIAEILTKFLEEGEKFGHASDAVYNNETADELLKKLDIKVEE